MSGNREIAISLDNLLGPIRILLIDEDHADVLLTQEAFKGDKIYCQMNVVSDGVEAMAYLCRVPPYTDAPRPDVILFDLDMPRMDGSAVLREVHLDRELSRIPVVILTASEAAEDLALAQAFDVACYVTKPVGLMQFTKIVQTLQALWFSIAALPPGRTRG